MTTDIVSENDQDRNASTIDPAKWDKALRRILRQGPDANTADVISLQDTLQDTLGKLADAKKAHARLEDELGYYLDLATDDTQVRPVLRAVLRRVFDNEYRAEVAEAAARQMADLILDLDNAELGLAPNDPRYQGLKAMAATLRTNRAKAD